MTSRKVQILVADDEEGIRFVLERLLEDMDCCVSCAEDGTQALELIASGPPAAPGQIFDVAILDIKMPGATGLEVMDSALKKYPELIILMVTAFGTPELARDAMKKGAYDYFTKPFDIEDMRQVVQRALEKKDLLAEIGDLKDQISQQVPFLNIIGESEPMQQVFELIERVCDNDVPVLVTGESGTGKELVACAIHQKGPRCNGPMVKVNCAAIPENLLESELFGHEKGSFTGAISQHAGTFEQAIGGTLFLDEIGDMPQALQAKILRAVQEGEFQRVGGTAPVKTDARLITATNRNLSQEVAAGRFREDLYFRINVITIALPPLRDRFGDIMMLAHQFLEKYNNSLGREVSGFSQEVRELFQRFEWPGNVRELENAIQRALIMSTESEITIKDLPPTVTGESENSLQRGMGTSHSADLSVPMPEAVEHIVELTEKQWITTALEKTSGRQETAELLGISRKSLHNKMIKYNMR